MIYCDCDECVHNNRDGECERDYVTIRSTFYANAPARCDDYDEREDEDDELGKPEIQDERP